MDARVKALGIALGILGLAQAKTYPTISYRDAARYVDEIVWVEGHVLKAERAREGTYLLFNPNISKYVTIFIPKEHLRNFQGSPDYLYVNKKVKALGKVERVGPRLMLGVSEPKRIKVIPSKGATDGPAS